jgi:hypothetical protein
MEVRVTETAGHRVQNQDIPLTKEVIGASDDLDRGAETGAFFL